MPIDFTAYTDPGIYVELIDPPVNNTTTISPTVVALVGTAGEEGRNVTTSTHLRDGYSSTLSQRGIDPLSLRVRSRFNLSQYTSAVIGTASSAVAAVSGAGTATLTVTTKEDFMLPAGFANVDYSERCRLRIDDRIYNAVVASTTATTYTFTISGLNASGVALIAKDTVVNLWAPYVTPIKVGTLRGIDQPNLDRSAPQFDLEQYADKIKRVRVPANATSASFTYNGHTVTLVATSTAKTAQYVADQLATHSIDAIVTRYNITVSGTDYIDYVIVLDDDAPTEMTVTGTDVTVENELGLTVGDLLLIDEERVSLEDLEPVSPSTFRATVNRGQDGTSNVSHGKVDIYYTAGYDYFVMNDSDGGDLDGVNDITILSVVPGGRLNSDGVEVRAYSTDAKQFAAEMFTDLDDVRDKYGQPIKSNGLEISSHLTLAAQLAMRNGATRVYCVATEANTADAFSDAIDKLANIDEIDVIVPITTNLNIGATEEVIAKVREFCAVQANLGNLMRAFVSVDGTMSFVQATDMASLAERISDPRVSLVAPSRFLLQTSNGKFSVGGPMAAAAVAGLHAALGPQEPLTRKQLELSVHSIEDPYTGKEQLDLQASGVLVLSQERARGIVVKHGLTTDMTSLYSREISVVAARDRLRDFVYDSLQNAGVLGSAITANTPELVVSNVTGALETAKRSTLIFEYADVKYRVPSDNPTAIEIRFAYRPTMPLNYILIQFSVDTSNSAVTFQTITEGGV